MKTLVLSFLGTGAAAGTPAPAGVEGPADLRAPRAVPITHAHRDGIQRG